VRNAALPDPITPTWHSAVTVVSGLWILIFIKSNSLVNKQHELIQRWDGFLQKIKDRFFVSTQQGLQAALDSLEENAYDFYSSLRVIASVKSQVYESLIKKINDTWRSSAEPSMQAVNLAWTDEMAKGYALEEYLVQQLDRFVMEAEGKLSQKYYEYAINLVEKEFNCTQCKAPLVIKKNFFKSQYVTCLYCQTVNTFEPETKYVNMIT
jgi:RNase P subunit RPR2